MRFLKKTKVADETTLVISDLHLSAGAYIGGRKNLLEDFHSDRELVAFIEYYSQGNYESAQVELIINGDFLDFLAVPFVPFFDDEFWSEQAAQEKLKLIIKAHKEVFAALDKFLSHKNKKITYIIGNHDGELVFESVKEILKQEFSPAHRERMSIDNKVSTYTPTSGVYIEHGHNYEVAHSFDQLNTIQSDINGHQYFMPSWGAYYVTHVINKYKLERNHLNQVRPIKHFLIHGLIFDTFFIVRFMIANAYYFIMVRVLLFKKSRFSWKEILRFMKKDLALFHDYESVTKEFFSSRPDAKVLIVGHTHGAAYTEYADGTKFINTGTWTKMLHLDLNTKGDGLNLTYALIEKRAEQLNSTLMVWSPQRQEPFHEY